jgi:hypothetical protein
MLLEHPDQPGRGVRLAYCSNLHPADDLAGALRGLREITLPLAERLGGARLREGFGVGLWLPAHVTMALTAEDGSPELDRLLEFLARHRLDAFTFNAFPYGDFHAQRLKQRVFEPTWLDPQRARWTFAVAWVACHLPRPTAARSHVSISTHTGLHSRSPRARDSEAALAAGFGAILDELATLQQQRIVLAMEAEPRANCGDTRELRDLFSGALNRARPADLLRAHLGTCLDACHAAVEFESASDALANAAANGAGLAKLQVTNALALRDPAQNHRGREALFAMAEPRYLHQVTGRGPQGLVRAGDLDEVAAAFASGDAAWSACDEWRCHFHVPVDLAALAGSGLETTRDGTDELLGLALAQPALWRLDELHLEIETYTWDVLSSEARGAGSLVDSLEREYRYALEHLAAAGWREDSSEPR